MHSYNRLLFLVLIFLLTFCGEKNYSYTKNTSISDSHGKPIDSLTWYFPANAITKCPPFTKEEGIVDTFWHEIFSKELYKFNEPVLSNYYLGETIIRLLWLPAFKQPVVLRLTNNNGKSYLFEKGYIVRRDSFLTTYGFYQEKFVTNRKENSISVPNSLYESIDSAFVNSKIFDIPSTKFATMGLDGSEWILEIHTKNKYHVIWRWSPEASDIIRQIGDKLLNISSYRFEEKY